MKVEPVYPYFRPLSSQAGRLSQSFTLREKTLYGHCGAAYFMPTARRPLLGRVFRPLFNLQALHQHESVSGTLFRL